MVYGLICQHEKPPKTNQNLNHNQNRNPNQDRNQRPDICNSNLAIKKPDDDDDVRADGEDYKSQILPNFQINCLRTLPKSPLPPWPDLKGFRPVHN